MHSRLVCLALFSCVAMPASPSFAAETRIVVDHRSVDSGDSRIPSRWLDKARSLRVYFGHQSVGNNIIDGLNALAAQKPERYSVAVRAQPDASWFAGHGGVGHFPVGRNGDAEGKIDDFSRRMSDLGDHVDVAMMKLCFVDIGGPSSDPERVFAAYRETMERLEKSHPRAKIVWWTEPINSRNNGARNRYNELVRRYARDQGKPLFDIADIESHDPRGKEAADGSGPVLYSGYTQDGGHLIMEGRLRAARAWWWLLARLSGWPGSLAHDEDAPSSPAASSTAAPPAARSARMDWWSACTAEREKFCRGVPAGGGRVVQCLEAHASELSDECKAARP